MKLPTPYQGDEKYIFISYSHKDTSKVDDIICKLSENGYHVWFDSGIVPGSEWDENIAQHIEQCGCFIAFMSENYLESNNCKDELNYARDLEKDRLVVYLEEVTLPSGLAMRINRLQSVFRYAYKSEKDFYEKLFSADCLEQCRKVAQADEMTDDVEGFAKDFVENLIKEKDEEKKEKKKFKLSQIKIKRKDKTKESKPKKKLNLKTLLWVNIPILMLSLLFIFTSLGPLAWPFLVCGLVFNSVCLFKMPDKKDKKICAICIVSNVALLVISCFAF